MEDFTPFLQIIHISDLHVTDPKSPDAAAIRGSMRNLRKSLPKSIAEDIEDGLLPHDPLAVVLFKDFADRITNQDPKWSKCRTWLLDTGDLTCLGDEESFDLGQAYLDQLTAICSERALLYGNHDAWPGKLPLWVAKRTLQKQASKLTKRKYTVGTAGLALEADIPKGGGRVQLFFLDSIVHDRWHNWRALGKVGTPQMDALKALVDKDYQQGRCDFRILAVHHPVHFPKRPRLRMSMSDDADVAKVLGERSDNGAYPLAHLVLSGHTHFLFPKHGELPLQPSSCMHPDLGSDQCQFVVGTLMQLDRFSKRPEYPHQCEVLRLYYLERDPSVLMIERLLAARQSGNDYRGTGIGPYQFVTLKKSQNKKEEPITFKLY